MGRVRRGSGHEGRSVSAATAMSMTAWTPARKGAAGLFIAIVFCGLACAAVYLSAVIFLLLNKVHPRHAEFTSIATYWDAYADDPKRRRTWSSTS